jgi:hypothetical protein
MADHDASGHGTRTPLLVMVAVGVAIFVLSVIFSSLVVLRCETVGLTHTAACSLNYDDDKAALGFVVLLLPTVVALVTSWVQPTRWWPGVAAGALMTVAELAILWPR